LKAVIFKSESEIFDKNVNPRVQENDIELLSRQRDQIVATFVRHTWVQEILKKSGKLNIEFPDEMKHMPKITLVKLKKTQELVTGKWCSSKMEAIRSAYFQQIFKLTV
jgi:hypothetical protein